MKGIEPSTLGLREPPCGLGRVSVELRIARHVTVVSIRFDAFRVSADLGGSCCLRVARNGVAGQTRGVVICPACGKENPEGFQFCGFCTAPLAVRSRAREVRKTVTVLFCDVSRLDRARVSGLIPEALRALLARYFERMRAIVESHGGTVEKFIGDAVMAVFGVPAGARGRRAAGVPGGGGDARRAAGARDPGPDRRQHRRGGDRARRSGS